MQRARRVRIVGLRALLMSIIIGLGSAVIVLAAPVGPKAITIFPPGERNTMTVPAILVTGNTADTKAAVLNYTNHSAGSPEFEFFDDYDAFLYKLAGREKAGVDYLGGKSVSDAAKAALDTAVTQLTNAQGNNPSTWRADMPQIVFQAVDVSSIQNIPWENRGTWGQAVDFGVQAATAPVASGSGGTPNTSRGVRWWVVMVVIAGVELTVRRMSRAR